MPIFLYAETHYKFPWFISYLRKAEPEIIADAPHRLEPNTPLPILVIIKDAHLFPVKLISIHLIINKNEREIVKRILLDNIVSIDQKIWWQVFDVEIENISGAVKFDVIFTIIQNGKEKIFYNDNYRTSSHKSLNVYIAEERLPIFSNLCFGECHSHSIYTEDQVEFGAPLEPTIKLSKGLGLNFFCTTDHSYDLDDSIENYLINDPKLPKWQLFQNEVDALNRKNNDFAIVRGEEVSCRNSKDKNVHLLLLGNRNYFYGSGDSAERWFKTYSENSITNILDKKENASLAFAAHPKEPVSFLQRILLKRNLWNGNDITTKNITGVQFANGKLSKGFWQGRQQWIDALLLGHRLFLLAGNDAHGNFNRFRQIGIPFFKIKETHMQLFGKMRTGVFTESISEEIVLKAISSGAIIISDGPVINIKTTSDEVITSIGKTYNTKEYNFSVEVISSKEFGTVEFCKIFIGRIGNKEDIFLLKEYKNSYSAQFNFNLNFDYNYYIRAEVWTSKKNSFDNVSHFCFTNPIWFLKN